MYLSLNPLKKNMKSDRVPNSIPPVLVASVGDRQYNCYSHLIKTLPSFHFYLITAKLFTKKHTKSNIFNEDFSSQCQLDDPDLPLPPFSHLSDNPLHNLVLSEKDIIDPLKTLNVSKASGPDGISPRMLKHTALSISPVLAKLFNLSLQTSYFPLIWKQANVILVFKKRNPTLTSYYRPVSLLSVVGKVF